MRNQQLFNDDDENKVAFCLLTKYYSTVTGMHVLHGGNVSYLSKIIDLSHP